jgi:hypothetical protein
MYLFCYHGLDAFYSTDHVPWSHGREVVPLWLSNYGVILGVWQEWVDRGTSLWLERNAALRKLIESERTFRLLFILEIPLMIVSLILLLTTVFHVWYLFLLFFIMFFLAYRICWRRYKNAVIFRNEEKWSELIRDINSSLKNHTPISARHCYRQNIVNCDCCLTLLTTYTLGVVFWSDDPKKFPTTECTHHPQIGGDPYDTVLKQSNADHLDWVIKLRPVDPNFGRVKGCIQCLWDTSNQKIVVPWSYAREKVPTWLSFQGVTLTAWQGWLDQASSLWIERIQQSNKISKMKLLVNTLNLLICLPWTMIIPTEDNPYLLGIMVMYSMIVLSFIVTFSKWEVRQQYEFLENEWKWSDLVQSINAEIVRDLGVRASHCYDTAIGRDGFSLQTVGLEFSMEPGVSSINV